MVAPRRRRLEKTLAKRIRQVAEARGVYLTHLADRSGLARSHFWRLLDAEHTTTLDVIAKIASVLDVEELVLLDEERPMPVAASSRTRPRRGKARKV